MRVENGTATAGNGLAVSHKVKHSHTIWPGNLFMGSYTREMGSSHKTGAYTYSS